MSFTTAVPFNQCIQEFIVLLHVCTHDVHVVPVDLDYRTVQLYMYDVVGILTKYYLDLCIL